MITMKEIAEKAGVSRGTVDRVLNDRGSVREETAKRILDIAQTFNYIPNKAARSLASTKKDIRIGYILFSPLQNPFFKPVEDGLRKKINEYSQYGKSVDIRYNSATDPTYQDRLIDELIDSQVSGLVFCGFNTSATKLKLDSLASTGFPIVTMNTDIPGSNRLAYVGSDYYRSGRTAGRLIELISGGEGNIGIILGSFDILCHSKRVDGFSDYIKENCPGLKIVSIKEGSDDDFVSYSHAKDMLTDEKNKIDLLYIASAGVYGICRAIETFPRYARPKVVSHDFILATRDMINRGIIAATICQEPDYQGSKPLDILFNYLVMGTPPSKECYYTDIEIKVKESVPL